MFTLKNEVENVILTLVCNKATAVIKLFAKFIRKHLYLTLVLIGAGPGKKDSGTE